MWFYSRAINWEGQDIVKEEEFLGSCCYHICATTLKRSLPRDETIAGIEQPSYTYAVQFTQNDIPEPVTVPTLETCLC